MSNNKKIHVKNLIVFIIILILIVVGIATTMSRYKSSGETTLSAEVAFYIVEDEYQSDQEGLEANIFLKDLYPREETFDYQVTVANTDGTNTAETAIEYTLEMEITTNLPLQFHIYKDGNELTNEDDIENKIVLDSTGQTYIRKITIKKGSFNYNESKTDTYKIAVEFPVKYAENEEFESMIDNINIKIDTKQKISEEE